MGQAGPVDRGIEEAGNLFLGAKTGSAALLNARPSSDPAIKSLAWTDQDA